MSEEKFQTYLAGAFCPYKEFEDWRDFVLQGVNNPRIKFYDPRRL